MKSKYIFLILTIFFSLFSINVFSTGAYKDTRGKDFWISFPPNFHNYFGSNQDNDTLFLYIASSVPTTGEIVYESTTHKIDSVSFQILDTNKMYVFTIGHNGYELIGFNQSGSLIYPIDEEVNTQTCFHITSKDDVVVYALNQATLTSDACVVLPTFVLGTEYYVLAWPSNGKSNGFNIDGSSTPSQFVIVANTDPDQVNACQYIQFGQGNLRIPIKSD